MAIKDVQTYIDKHGLIETEDSEVEKPIYRKPGFDGVHSLLAMEEDLSQYLRERRDAQNLNREQVGMMIGIHAEILARHERAGAKLRVTRLIHLAELLDFSPVEAIHAAAPHLFGESQLEADVKLKLMLRMLDLPASTAEHLLMLVEELAPAGAGTASQKGRDSRRRS